MSFEDLLPLIKKKPERSRGIMEQVGLRELLINNWINFNYVNKSKTIR